MEITTRYLEQTAADQLRPATPVSVTCTRSELVSPEFSRFLYTSVGGDWKWVGRLGWSWQRWHDWLDRPRVETWVAYLRGTPAGYVELDGATGEDVEIAYFGLLPAFVGKGIGGHLLTVALRRAWELTNTRVWVHTCSLDSPTALANYQARGLTVYRTETTDEDVPGTSPGPWPGAR